MDKTRIMRRNGAWAIALGAIAITVGVSVGVGCLVMGGQLLKGAR